MRLEYLENKHLILDTRKEIGNAALSMAIAYFGSNGYIVSIPLNDTQDYDLIVDKNGCVQRVQVKGDKHNQNVQRIHCWVTINKR